MNAPIYAQIYMFETTPTSDHHVILVADNYGNSGYMTEMTNDDLALALTSEQRRPIYCKVDHPLEYPYTTVDFTQVIDHDFSLELFGKPTVPYKFTQAALVCTPRMALI